MEEHREGEAEQEVESEGDGDEREKERGKGERKIKDHTDLGASSFPIPIHSFNGTHFPQPPNSYLKSTNSQMFPFGFGPFWGDGWMSKSQIS